ncbi:MAG: hypothetical protein ACHQ49_07125 [Elusimicrobiota bacterium]
MPKRRPRRAARFLRILLLLAASLGSQACSPAGPSPAERRLRLRGEIYSRFRFFHEDGLLHADQTILNKKIFSITKPDPAILGEYLAASRRLTARAQKMSRHFAEDAAAFSATADSPDAKDIVARGEAYAESTRDCVGHLAVIVERLERMTRQPQSWTKPEYTEAVDEYARAGADTDAKGSAFRGALEAMNPR